MYIIFLLVCVAVGYKIVYFFGVLLVLLSFICVLCSLIKKFFFCLLWCAFGYSTVLSNAVQLGRIQFTGGV